MLKTWEKIQTKLTIIRALPHWPYYEIIGKLKSIVQDINRKSDGKEPTSKIGKPRTYSNETYATCLLG